MLNYEKELLDLLDAQSVLNSKLIQTLWSGYGELRKVTTDSKLNPRVVVKNISFPNQQNHPRGWNSSNSHNRQVKSYQVEWSWYEKYAHMCNDGCRIPNYIASRSDDNRFLVLEDLDEYFPLRKSSLSVEEAKVCLRWLAHFHARFMNTEPKGLWSTGTYWHLETRPDELKVMEDNALKEHAFLIDEHLNNCKYKTIVHGDAKVANFCFSEDMKDVAAVDFQYVGGGCGMKDVVYFLGSCLLEDDIKNHDLLLLDYYFETLKEALNQYHPYLVSSKIEQEWRAMYAIAWTDFTRFLMGWMPTHQKITGYSLELMRKVLESLSK